MRFFCTYFDQNYLTRGLALHESLKRHAGSFKLWVLCMDTAAETALRNNRLPQIEVIPLKKLVETYPALSAAQADRSNLEFYFTCTSWLVHHLLSHIPEGDLLTYLDADLFFFSSPEPIYAEIGPASIAITPHRFPSTLAHLERYGRYNVGWLSFRNNSTGRACAADWAEKCAEWCFNRLEDDRYADQKYLDTWETRFSGAISITHPGANVAPWNVRDASFSQGPKINDIELIFYHFHALTHVGNQLFDSGLHRYDANLSEALRQEVYLPYLHVLLRFNPTPSRGTPDLIPPADPKDERHPEALHHILKKLMSSELDRGQRLLSIEENIRATKQAVAYLAIVEQDRDKARAEQSQTVEYLKAVEKDSNERLASIHFYQDKLKTAYGDLERNVAYLKTLETEIQAHIKVNAQKDQIIQDLAQRLKHTPGNPASDTL